MDDLGGRIHIGPLLVEEDADEHPDGKERHQPQGKPQVAPAHFRLGGERRQEEYGADHDGQRVGEEGYRRRQRGQHGPTVGEQHHGAERERQGEQERILTVGEVDDQHRCQSDSRPVAGAAIRTSHVKVVEHRQSTGGDDHQHVVAHELRQPVEDEAVADYLIGAAVPVVVPEHGLVLTQQSYLVEVRRRVPADDAQRLHSQRGGREAQDRQQDEPDKAQPAEARTHHARGPGKKSVGSKASPWRRLRATGHVYLRTGVGAAEATLPWRPFTAPLASRRAPR